MEIIKEPYVFQVDSDLIKKSYEFLSNKWKDIFNRW